MGRRRSNKEEGIRVATVDNFVSQSSLPTVLDIPSPTHLLLHEKVFLHCGFVLVLLHLLCFIHQPTSLLFQGGGAGFLLVLVEGGLDCGDCG